MRNETEIEFKQAVKFLVDADWTKETAERLDKYYFAVIDNTNSMTIDTLNWALGQFKNKIPELGYHQASIIAVRCGAMVECGADPLIAYDAIIQRTKSIIEDALPFIHACDEVDVFEEDDEEQLKISMKPFKKQFPDTWRAWKALRNLFVAINALLLRSKEARGLIRAEKDLLQQFEDLRYIVHSVKWINESIAVLDEDILVLHPAQKKGFTITINGIAGIGQLHLLLADALIGNPQEGWLAGQPPNTKSVAVAKKTFNLNEKVEDFAINGIFELMNWFGLLTENSLENDLGSHTVWSEKTPAHIPKLKDVRIVLLGEPLVKRSWESSMNRPILDMIPELTVKEKLSPEKINQVIKQILERKYEEYTKTEEKYRMAIQKDPNDPHPWAELGYILQRQGNIDACRDAWNKALSFAPANWNYRERLQKEINNLK